MQGEAGEPDDRQRADDLRQRIHEWELANPGIDLVAQLPGDGQFERTDRATIVPQPPEWFTELTPKQRALWDALKMKALAGGDSAAMQSAAQTFLAADPSDGARANADYLILLARTKGLPAAEAAKIFAEAQWTGLGQVTEAGLPIGQLICYQALRLTPTGAGMSDPFPRRIARAAIDRPIFFTPQLIREWQRVVKGTDVETNAMYLKDWLETERRERQVVEDFLDQYPTNTWASAPFWVDSAGGKYLLLIYGGSDISTNLLHQRPDDYPYLLFSQAMVDRALSTAVDKAGISIPPYARVEFEMGGEKIILSHHEIAGPTNAVLALLGEAGGTWETLPLTTNAYPFRITAHLANPGLLYARQHQRTWLFSGLIVVSTGTAVMGLLAAWRSFRRQRELSELKSNFVSGVSHELRAPIASVRLMAENLEQGKVPEAARQNEYFRFIVQECRRLSSLIENVLDFSRIEQGRKQYEFEPTDLAALTQMTVKLMEPYAAEKGVRLEFSTDGQPAKMELNVDGRAIQQALVNLIDNAVKHSAKGQTVIIKNEKLKIKNGTGADASEVVQLSVSDHGPGIPREEQEKIFERFYRLGSELRRETQGVGIGLSVVKHIV